MMGQVLNLIIFMFFSLQALITNGETEEVRLALVQFLNQMSPGNNVLRDASFGWNATSDPCSAGWTGVKCSSSQSVKKIVLDGMNLTGSFDAKSLCIARSLAVFSMNDNNVGGDLPQEISNCSHLTHVYLKGNKFSGNLPSTLSRLNNLKRLDISNNSFSGELPDLARISGLLTFLAQDNDLSGKIPDFDFNNFEEFNVSYNNFTGPIPNDIGHFGSSSFLGNEELCGAPILRSCPDLPPPSPVPLTVYIPSSPKKKHSSSKQWLLYSGYGILVSVIIALLIAFKFKKRKKPEGTRNNDSKEDISSSKPSTSTESKAGGSRSEFSLTSPDNAKASTLVVLSSPVLNGLKFEDLLRAPAELLGKGKHGTLYKVTLNTGLTLAVKRIKDWVITRDEFKKRMHKIDRARHRNVLPVAAYYCSRQEKLLVYEFQQNGSLFRLLHGSQYGETFDWESRLNVAGNVAKALAFMHEELRMEDMAHGNLKSSNILMNKDMEPCISEYGLMEADANEQLSFVRREGIEENVPTSSGKVNGFKADVYAFGVILLELLTGKLVHNRRSDLARWVHSVVREEWTAEVFDKGLITEGASEERMVNLLQVALKCINPSPEARPNMSQVAVLINAVKEDEEKSLADISEV